MTAACLSLAALPTTAAATVAVLQAWADSKSVDPAAYEMMFDGKNMQPGDTPRSVGLEMMDIVAVVVKHTGGGR